MGRPHTYRMVNGFKMRKTLITFLLLCLSTFGFARTVAQVNGQVIDSSLVDRQVEAMRQQMGSKVRDTQQLRNSIVNAAIVHAVIVQEARRLRLDEESEYRSIVNRALNDAKRSGEDRKPNFRLEYEVFKENLLEQAYYVHIVKTRPVTENELRNEYQNLVNFYKHSSEILIGQIITKNPNDAKQAISDLKRGIRFQDVASRFTIDPEGRKNGGIPRQYINLNDLKVAAPSLFELIKNIPKGSFTAEPLRSGSTYAVFYIADIRPARVPSYETMKGKLQSQLGDERVNKAIDALMRKAKIQRFDR